MSKTLIALLFAVPFAAPVAATQYLRVVNAAASPIVAVEAAPIGTSAWGQLSLADRPVHPGRQLGVALDGSRRCRYDLRVVYADGREVLAPAFNLCRHPHAGPATLRVGAGKA
ncbi:hypothetical protein ATSB10_17640 [Dyella thiooxydans]|uniref:Uncharacterized protein n=1 Tax=Dyella thiooxydans TaxID=445710 RepID=A0A160N1J2_9GAMM|nr:hypothetical protein [Dyella thiooxydans]AND69218.1 hypothetical protein ATSB10_17640 [Dyella thiooxydans]